MYFALFEKWLLQLWDGILVNRRAAQSFGRLEGKFGMVEPATLAPLVSTVPSPHRTVSSPPVNCTHMHTQDTPLHFFNASSHPPPLPLMSSLLLS